MSELLKDREGADNESEQGAWKSLILEEAEEREIEEEDPNPEIRSHKKAVLGGCIVREN